MISEALVLLSAETTHAHKCVQLCRHNKLRLSTTLTSLLLLPATFSLFLLHPITLYLSPLLPSSLTSSLISIVACRLVVANHPRDLGRIFKQEIIRDNDDIEAWGKIYTESELVPLLRAQIVDI